MRELLVAGLIEAVRVHDVSSLHLNFLPEDDAAALGERGFLRRVGLQYHWHNHGYGHFDDFLGDLASRKRKAIRKERREVANLTSISVWPPVATCAKRLGRVFPFLHRHVRPLMGRPLFEPGVL